ncbi:MAG: DUF4270 family protein [Bacteroidales bacterium]
MRSKTPLFFLGIELILIATIFSCNNSNESVIGNDFILPDGSMVYTDTVSVNMSTLILDSIQTANQKVALVGRYNDKNIGTLNSKSFMIMGADSYTLDEYAVYDSLVLVLTPSGYYYGDTLTPCTIKVHEVKETIEIDNDEGYISNLSDFEVDPNPIGEKKFYARPKSKDEIRIPMSDELGLKFTNKFKSGTHPFEEDEGFTNYFKGIMLQVDDGTNTILEFEVNNESISLQLYYHIEDSDIQTEDERDTLFIPPSNTSLQFNQIKADSTNSVISQLSEEPIGSAQLNNSCYVQGGTGIVARIDFPTLHDFLQQDRKFEILKAILVIQPSLEMDMNYLPSELYLYVTNKHNDFIARLTDASGNAITGSLYEDFIYRENTRYSWDITSFINVLAKNPSTTYNGLLLLPVDYNSKFNNVVIADQQQSQHRTQLELYVLYYE